MKLFDKKTAQVLLTTLVFALVLLFLYVVWRAIITFLFAIFFAYLLEAPVSKLQGWLRGSRTAAIAVVYLILIIGLSVVFWLVGDQVMQQGQKLMEQAPQWSEQISSGQLVQQVGARRGWSQTTIDRVSLFIQSHQSEIVATTQNFVVRAAKSIQSMWWLLLVPILAIFFLKDGRKMGERLVNSVEDARIRRIVAETVNKMNLMVAHYIRAQITLAGLAMVVVTFVLWIMRVPYAFALGPAAGALEFIPVVGPAIGGLVVLAVALLSGYHHVIWVLVFLLIWRGIQDYVSAPRIVGSTLELHPLTVLFGVLAGGEVAGVIGVFLSIPVLATLRILWHAWMLQRNSERTAA
ncbi:MAG TPA: AI-2E family transporter [Candidatus Sulfotelmatobacter sp.]|nr:AI-2E family transporter [Candidatus Sulfotelmatobacter sp.]